MYQVNAKGYKPSYYASREDAKELGCKLAALSIPHSIRELDYWHVLVKIGKHELSDFWLERSF